MRNLLITLFLIPCSIGETVRADELPTSSSAAPPQTPVLECQSAGPRYSRACQAFEEGRQWANAGDARCVDRFFQSASLCWQDMTEGLAHASPQLRHRSLQLYNSAVLSGVVAGHRLGRLDPEQGLRVFLDERWQTVPVTGRGIVWRMDQIDCFRPAPTEYKNRNFARTVQYGVGAPLLGIHFRRPDIPGEHRYFEQHPFAITAIFRPTEPTMANTAGAVLELYSPVKHRTVAIHGRELRLSNNIAGAVEFAMDRLRTTVNPLAAFFNPDIAVNHEGVLMLQPYQPNKIPLVLVHGLLANPATWGTIINELLNQPELMERYQIWAYLYPTSVPFLKTAADFRQDLRSTLSFLDPEGKDDALQNMILIGHSMGGLLSRLQVVWSGQILWSEFAKVPFSAIRGSREVKQLLANVFFFEPQPFVKRVVFVAVPHRGSPMSVRLVGCIGRILAGQLPQTSQLWKQLYELNSDAFRVEIASWLPSSVAGLATRSPALRGLAKLPFASGVPLHSIIGTGGCEPCFPGDGVVTVESARLPGVDSEIFVDATHTSIKDHPRTIHEINRILWLHWSETAPHGEASVPETRIPAPMPMP